MNKFSPQKYPVLITILALTAVYALAYLYERSLLRLVWHERDSIDYFPFYWRSNIISSIAPLLVILLIFALYRLLLHYLSPNRFAATLYLLSGVFILGLSFSYYLPLILPGEIIIPVWLRPQSTLGRIRLSFMNFGDISCRPPIYYLACGCILIGIVALWKLNKKKHRYAEET